MNEVQKVKENRLSPELLAGIILALFFGIALFIRVYLPYEQVFSGEWIKFTSVDAYFHMRLVDNLVHNFPHLTDFAPYLHYPFGIKIDNIHFYDWLLAGIIWVIGLGSPTQHTIDAVAVYFPAVLAALTVIPVYFIGKELFGRWAGVLSAGLIAILPGEYLGRSLLGFTDHHVAETLFTATTMMFLILAIKASRERGLTFNHLQSRDWPTISKPIICSLLAGLFLGIYLITWIGALLFVFIITFYFVIQFIIDHLRRQSTDYLVPVGVSLFLTALIIYLLFSRSVLSWTSLFIALLIPIVLNVASQLMKSRKIRPAYYPLVVVGLGVVGLVIFYAISPSFFQTVFNRFDIFTWGGTRTILEMQPLLSPRGEFTLQLAWGNFTTGFFLSIGLLLYWIIYKRIIRKQGSAEENTLLVWSLVIFATTLGQRRFAYYFAVNVALLTGYLLWQLFKLNKENHPNAKYLNIVFSVTMIVFLVFFLNLNPLLVAVSVGLLSLYVFWQVFEAWLLETPKTAAREKAKHKKTQRVGFHLTLRHINIALAVMIGLPLVFFPNIEPAIATASQAHFAPSNAWMNSLTWLKENTPEPFGDPAAYYQLYESPPPKEKFKYPESAYAVMSWVDYGYWITRIAHRPANLTPGPGGGYVAKFFVSQDENSTLEVKWKTKWEEEIIAEKEIIEKLDSAYIIIDHQTAISKFWALVNWAERELPEFFDLYYVPQEKGELVPIQLFHPAYYRSLVVRLYNFDGQAVTPEISIVISYEEKVVQEDESIKLITHAQNFPSYEEATAYISSQKSGNYRIVSDNPFISPVPLAELKHYKLIYSSDISIIQPGVGAIPSVKIFEYITRN